MKILIIEDERPAAMELQKLVEHLQPDAKVVAIIPSNEELIAWVESNNWPQLIFSDIELLDGPVFNSLEMLNPRVPIIFTTAYDHYMAEAFDSAGIAYLLKPFNQEQIKRALNKFELLSKSDTDWKRVGQLLENHLGGRQFKNRLTIRKGSGMYLLPVSDITCFRMVKGVLHAFDTGGKSHIISMGLSDLLTFLDPAKFFQVNRGEAIGLTHIERLESYGKDRLAAFVVGQSSAVISSSAKTPAFRKWMEQ